MNLVQQRPLINITTLMTQRSFNRSNSITLALLTLAFTSEEICHYLLGTLSREVAQDVHFGRLKCYEVDDIIFSTNVTYRCQDIDTEQE